MGTVLLTIFCCQENRPHDNKTTVEEKYRFFSFGDAMLIG
jgi:S-adenosylmethionine:tRNA-ribosyltransferase-isomerase (queuine synthetase)